MSPTTSSSAPAVRKAARRVFPFRPAPRPEGADYLAQLAHRRRATAHFTSATVPQAVITEALAIAAEAPSGYNLQPWRFVVIRDPANRARLREAAHDQPKITEAPVVIVAFGERDGWQQYMDEIFATRATLTGVPADLRAQRHEALAFIDTLPREVWLNRHVMLGFTYLMLAFEALGWDTAPMEGFSAPAVRAVAGLPDDAVVVALLAVGRASGPEPAHPGRLTPDTLAYNEHYGQPFNPLSPSHP